MGHLQCSGIECTSVCSLLGYNHIRTFDGGEFTYDVGGDLCYYTLVEVKPQGLVTIFHFPYFFYNISDYTIVYTIYTISFSIFFL